jgi:hypothetical protein
LPLLAANITEGEAMTGLLDELDAIKAELDALRAENARLRAAFATFTEYQLATLEGLPTKTSKREHQRQQKIADMMVNTCKLFGFKPTLPFYGRWGTPRLNKFLKQQPSPEIKP